jgi:hypothetical protein
MHLKIKRYALEKRQHIHADKPILKAIKEGDSSEFGLLIGPRFA